MQHHRDPGWDAALARLPRHLAPEVVSAVEKRGEKVDALARSLLALLVTAIGGELPIRDAVRLSGFVGRCHTAGVPLEAVLEIVFALEEALATETGTERVRAAAHRVAAVVARSFLTVHSTGLEERERELRALIKISRAANRSLELREVAESSLRATVAAMHLDAGALWLAEPAIGLRLLQTVGLNDDEVAALNRVDLLAYAPVAEALAAGRARHFSVNPGIEHLAAYRSALAVPLYTGSGLVALLAVASRRRRQFDSSDIAFVGTVGEHVAAALGHAFEHRRAARTDYLTGLANRAEFDAAMEREVAAATRHGRRLTLLLLDLDKLKTINDEHGHHAGDAAIRATAAVLKPMVRASDVCARLGGDEFGVAMPDAGQADAEEVAARIRDRLAALPVDDDLPAPIEVSVGIAEWSEGAGYPELFADADRRLYREKRRRSARRRRAAARLVRSSSSFPSTGTPAKPSR